MYSKDVYDSVYLQRKLTHFCIHVAISKFKRIQMCYHRLIDQEKKMPTTFVPSSIRFKYQDKYLVGFWRNSEGKLKAVKYPANAKV